MDALISVIVPVYNADNYIDECVESLIKQTFDNLEIILINDGSTDKSGEKCIEWKNKDTRIVYMDKKNEGAGLTRNLGLEMAKGEYISFVDSDDWVDSKFLEELYNNIIYYDSEWAECDMYRYHQESGVKNYISCNGYCGKVFEGNDKLIYGFPSLCKTLTKKSVWIDNGLKMPDMPLEDLAIYNLVLTLCRNPCAVLKPLYYYRKARKDSVSSNLSNYLNVSKSMQYLLDGFKHFNLYEEYKEELYRFCCRFILKTLAPMMDAIEETQYFNIKSKYIQFMNDNFDEFIYKQYILIGSFNMVRVTEKVKCIGDPFNRFNFMSIISIMSENKMGLEIKHFNRYRKFMLQREMDRKVRSSIEKIKADYIFIDFIEERHDIIDINGQYYTYSDAFQETEVKLPNYNIISRFSDECQELWEISCIKYIEFLRKNFRAENVILMKNFLTENYGNLNVKENYSNLLQIKKINKLLNDYYDFFINHFEGIKILETKNSELFFTDEKFEYGKYPWHVNELYNLEISKRIEMGILL